MATIMQSKDAIYGSTAECYVTLNGRRFNFMSLTEFLAELDVETVDVPILGKIGTGHKSAGMKGTWSAKAHYNQSYIREVALEYQNTGVMPYFEIQVTNEDATSGVGRQTIILYNCLFNKFVLAKFDTGSTTLDEDLSGTFDSFDMPETFNDMAGFVTT